MILKPSCHLSRRCVCFFIGIFLVAVTSFCAAQQAYLVPQVNVFLGTSGDHGQLSPAASYPFSMLDIGPQTYPNTHTGYEYKAKVFLGFTHGRMEGVGCRGSGGNLLIKPFIGADPHACELFKTTEKARPGYYSVGFKNGINASFAVNENSGIEHYHLPMGKHGFFIDLSHTLANRFVAEEHQHTANSISGWIESGTTCNMGIYRIYYNLLFDQHVTFKDSTAHTFTIETDENNPNGTVYVTFSSVDVAHTKVTINKAANSQQVWNRELSRIQVKGNRKEEKLFYSLLYRTLQSPYKITEPDGAYRATDGSLQSTRIGIFFSERYSGWSIWDNYRTELPLLSLMEPGRYGDVVSSIAELYKYGKKDWATKTEPSNTVRTEHAIVVLLDAYRKGYPVDFKSIRDSLLKETDHLDFKTPDKALESSYDTWAMSQILAILKEDSLGKVYLNKAANWKYYWYKDFKDLTKKDVDELETRKMYQGTIWQYRWFVPFDNKGLIEACGGEAAYLHQLDEFFAMDYYNAANEPDIQVPYMYSFTSRPWKSQAIIHKYVKDTVVQYYQDDNYRGIGPQIGRVYNNRPDGLLQTMDEDAGEMSSWYVMAACGLSPACVGCPIYYLNVPLFKTIRFNNQHPFTISVTGNGKYIRFAMLNGKPLDRNWLTQQEIIQGGKLAIIASVLPNKTFGINNQLITELNKQ